MSGNNTFKNDGGAVEFKQKDKIAHSARGWQEKRGGGYLRGKKISAHIRTYYTHARGSGWKIVIGPHSAKARGAAAEGEGCLFSLCDVFAVPAC